jgi:hypothetical protein
MHPVHPSGARSASIVSEFFLFHFPGDNFLDLGKGLVDRVVTGVRVLVKEIDNAVRLTTHRHQTQIQAVLNFRLAHRIDDKNDDTERTQRKIPQGVHGQLDLKYQQVSQGPLATDLGPRISR